MGVIHERVCLLCVDKKQDFSTVFFFSFLALCLPNNRSVLMAVIVEKSKKVLDFSVTLFFIHFVLCILYNGFPST